MKRVAVFAGSFNPFTIGHKSIVDRGLQLFDKIIIGVGVNPDKLSDENVVERCNKISAVFKGNDAVEVMPYTGLTAEFVKKSGASVILRGVRNVIDFEYERNLADINMKVLGVETCLLFSLPEYSYVSASMVRELESNGFDASEYVARQENDLK